MTKLSALAFAVAMWVLFSTLRRQVVTEDKGINPYDPPQQERFLYCVWHDSMVIPTFGGSHPCTTALTSQHTDGSFVAETLKCHGVSTVRGSTNRITTTALRSLLAKAESQHIVITPDGPRGPNRCMSAGMVVIASRTGRAIVPTAFTCSRAWRIKGSWSDLVIPKPFAKVVLLAGTPIYVEPNLPSSQIQDQVTAVQTAMDRLDEKARGLLVGSGYPENENGNLCESKRRKTTDGKESKHR